MENRSKEELIQLAKDIKNNLVFIDRYIPENQSIESIFMPLLFMESEAKDSLRKDPPGLIYEYLSHAGPRAINGLPSFMSFRMISIEDTITVSEILKKLDSAEEEILKEFEKS